jgi:uncharacterized protein (UPF0305 family)
MINILLVVGMMERVKKAVQDMENVETFDNVYALTDIRRSQRFLISEYREGIISDFHKGDSLNRVKGIDRDEVERILAQVRRKLQTAGMKLVILVLKTSVTIQRQKNLFYLISHKCS